MISLNFHSLTFKLRIFFLHSNSFIISAILAILRPSFFEITLLKFILQVACSLLRIQSISQWSIPNHLPFLSIGQLDHSNAGFLMSTLWSLPSFTYCIKNLFLTILPFIYYNQEIKQKPFLIFPIRILEII